MLLRQPLKKIYYHLLPRARINQRIIELLRRPSVLSHDECSIDGFGGRIVPAGLAGWHGCIQLKCPVS